MPQGLRYSEPLHKAILNVIASKEGQEAIMNCVNSGKPPNCGIDALLQKELKELYISEVQNNSRGVAQSVGSAVANFLKESGYASYKQGNCRKESLIKSGLLFQLKK